MRNSKLVMPPGVDYPEPSPPEQMIEFFAYATTVSSGACMSQPPHPIEAAETGVAPCDIRATPSVFRFGRDEHGPILGRNHADGTVECGMCEWSTAPGELDAGIAALRDHLATAHSATLRFKVDDRGLKTDC